MWSLLLTLGLHLEYVLQGCHHAVAKLVYDSGLENVSKLLHSGSNNVSRLVDIYIHTYMYIYTDINICIHIGTYV